jgi:Holliday junction resolvase
VKEAKKKLEKEGYRVIDLENKSPDLIAVKEDKIIAVEILGMQYDVKRKYWKKKFTIKSKEQIYYMFDEVRIITFKRN